MKAWNTLAAVLSLSLCFGVEGRLNEKGEHKQLDSNHNNEPVARRSEEDLKGQIWVELRNSGIKREEDPSTLEGLIWVELPQETDDRMTVVLEETTSRLQALRGMYTPLKRRQNIDHKKRLESISEHHRALLARDKPINFVSRANGGLNFDYKIRLQDHESEYTGEIEIGTPGQKLECIFDTGSSMAWLFSTKSIHFGTGALIGSTARDNIKMGGVVLENQDFGEIIRPIGDVFSLEFDGICGLSYPMSYHSDASLLLGVKNSKKLSRDEDKAFTFYFGRSESAMVVGHPPEELTGGTKNMKWYPVSKKYYWESILKDVTIGGKSILKEVQRTSYKNLSAVFDTGTSVLTMPSEYAAIMLHSLKKDGINCDAVVSGKAPKLCYKFEKGDDICITNWFEQSSYEGFDCEPSVMTLDLMDEDIFILGQPFFSEYVTTFDVGRDMIGVVPNPDNMDFE